MRVFELPNDYRTVFTFEHFCPVCGGRKRIRKVGTTTGDFGIITGSMLGGGLTRRRVVFDEPLCCETDADSSVWLSDGEADLQDAQLVPGKLAYWLN